MRNASLWAVLITSAVSACAAPESETAAATDELGSQPRLYRESQSYADGVLTIDIAVDNVTYHKVCAALITGDDWMWKTYEGASYVEPIAGGNYERWRIELDAADYGDEYVASAAVLEYALVCFFDGDPNPYWDNNGGQDYRLDRSWPADIDGLDTVTIAQLVVTGDGGVVVVDRDDYRSLAFYDADGDLACTVDSGDYVAALHYVEGVDIVLTQGYGATWPERRWRAYTTDGALLWDVSAALEQVVPAAAGDPDARPFLVGTAGAAVLARTAPVIVGPAGERCAGFPVLTPGGRLLCQREHGVYAYDVVTGGVDDVVYPLGVPWGADDAGHVVLAASDRRALSGYDGEGTELWTLTTDYLWSPYPVSGGQCTNSAAGGGVAFIEGSWPQPSFTLVDLATGAARFETEVESYSGACAHADGRYYLSGVYDRGLVRLDPDGSLARYRAVWGISQVQVYADGQVMARVSGYHEPYDPTYAERVVVLDDDLVERLSHRSDFGYPPGPALFARTSAFAAIGSDVAVTRFAF